MVTLRMKPGCLVRVVAFVGAGGGSVAAASALDEGDDKKIQDLIAEAAALVKRIKARREQVCREERDACHEAFARLREAARDAERLAARFEADRRREPL